MGDFSRMERLIGKEAFYKLQNSYVAVFGIGGVGSFTAEALARCGIARLALFDMDTVSSTNINRQIIALNSTIGRKKVEVMAERIKDINPLCEVSENYVFYGADNEKSFDLTKYDYVVDAIDTVSSKLLIIENCVKADIPVISSMGTGNKLDPTAFEISDISKTSMCPLARVMRKELKARGITKLKVLYSKEKPISPIEPTDNSEICQKRQIPGSISFVPSVAGLIIAGEVVKDIIKS